MPGLYKDEGVVLKTIKLGEADRILTIFTRYNGKVRAVGKGVRRTKSRFGGRLEPFSRLSLMLYRGRGDLDTITSADILDPYKGIRSDLDRLTRAAAFAEVVDKITPDRERALPTYRLLTEGLDALNSSGAGSVVPAFLVKLLSLSGYHPQTTVCAACGRSDGLDGFSPALGGAICSTCHYQDDDAIGLPHDRFALLSHMLVSEMGEEIDSQASADLTHVLWRYTEYYLERPLRSLNLLTTASVHPAAS